VKLKDGFYIDWAFAYLTIILQLDDSQLLVDMIEIIPKLHPDCLLPKILKIIHL